MSIRSFRPSRSRSLNCRIDSAASSSLANSTKAKPRGRPVSRSLGKWNPYHVADGGEELRQLLRAGLKAQIADEDFGRNGCLLRAFGPSVVTCSSPARRRRFLASACLRFRRTEGFS